MKKKKVSAILVISISSFVISISLLIASLVVLMGKKGTVEEKEPYKVVNGATITSTEVFVDDNNVEVDSTVDVEKNLEELDKYSACLGLKDKEVKGRLGTGYADMQDVFLICRKYEDAILEHKVDVAVEYDSNERVSTVCIQFKNKSLGYWKTKIEEALGTSIVSLRSGENSENISGYSWKYGDTLYVLRDSGKVTLNIVKEGAVSESK